MGKKQVLAPLGINSSTGQHHTELSGVGGIWTDNRPDAWVQYDLGGLQKVGGVGIKFDSKDTIYRFSVQTSPDGLGYSNVLTGRKSVKKEGIVEYKFVPKLTRFIRLIIHENNTPDTTKAAIDVFQVLGGTGGKGKGKAKKAKANLKVKKVKKKVKRNW